MVRVSRTETNNNPAKRPRIEEKERDSYECSSESLDKGSDPSKCQQTETKCCKGIATSSSPKTPLSSNSSASSAISKPSTQPKMPGDTGNRVAYHAQISGDETKRCHTCDGHLWSIFAVVADLPRELDNESRQVIHKISFDVTVVQRLSKL